MRRCVHTRAHPYTRARTFASTRVRIYKRSREKHYARARVGSRFSGRAHMYLYVHTPPPAPAIFLMYIQATANAFVTCASRTARFLDYHDCLREDARSVPLAFLGQPPAVPSCKPH
mmetsp:Transcript_35346/g.74213  ORF Transcript_35346/g.74213 Transcript_35346/m.74213 type:complete len:116 (-) Transcript_35346:328-675(-)